LDFCCFSSATILEAASVLLLLKLVALTAAAVAAPVSWISTPPGVADVVDKAPPPAVNVAVDPTDAVVFLEGELFLEVVLDLEDRDEVGTEDSRGFISLPLLPWRIKFLSCSSKGAIVYMCFMFFVREKDGESVRFLFFVRKRKKATEREV
jgi:hypothetical protein